MNIVLIGYRGCGKSTAGRMLAERLGWAFVDTDELIEQRSGKTIREIFADWAEEGFRDLESEVIAEVACHNRQVISTGGGAILRPTNAEALEACGKIVYITAPPDMLWERILADTRRRTTRPDMDFAKGLQQVRDTMRERGPLYERWADAIVDTSYRSPEDVVERILTRLNLRALLPPQ